MGRNLGITSQPVTLIRFFPCWMLVNNTKLFFRAIFCELTTMLHKVSTPSARIGARHTCHTWFLTFPDQKTHQDFVSSWNNSFYLQVIKWFFFFKTTPKVHKETQFYILGVIIEPHFNLIQRSQWVPLVCKCMSFYVVRSS